MAKQTINQGAIPTGAGGDTFRSGSLKLQQNDDELYAQLGADSSGKLPPALPISKGGTGATTAAKSRENLGLKGAATYDVGSNPNQIPTIGNFGLLDRGYGFVSRSIPANSDLATQKYVTGWYSLAGAYENAPTPTAITGQMLVNVRHYGAGAALVFLVWNGVGADFWVGACNYSNNNEDKTVTPSSVINWKKIYTTGNTTTDNNGFIKAASPIVQLYSDHIKLNDEAQQQEIIFKKNAVGDYLIQGSSGFAQEGWYIEQPKDANGNVLVAVVYKQNKNGDISIKTYKKKFDIEAASIVADLTQPIDIPKERWIDLRLQEIPQPEVIEAIHDTE